MRRNSGSTRSGPSRKSRLFAWQEEHARRFEDWQERRDAFEKQPQWYAVSLPTAVDRVDLVGGTLSGWSAVVTVVGASRLTAGGELTVVDVSEGAVARDLLAVAERSGIAPLVWVLPADLAPARPERRPAPRGSGRRAFPGGQRE